MLLNVLFALLGLIIALTTLSPDTPQWVALIAWSCAGINIGMLISAIILHLQSKS